jgi:ATP-dependent DNA ligase
MRRAGAAAEGPARLRSPSSGAMLRSKLPAGFVVPAQPVKRAAPPSGADWVHELKHDGYRIIVRRDGERVRLFSRKAIDWTARLPAIAEGAGRLKASQRYLKFSASSHLN